MKERENLLTRGKRNDEQRERRTVVAGFLGEMITLGWTLENFDEDFDEYVNNSEDDAGVTEEEKDECREIFEMVWEDRLDEFVKGNGFSGDSFGASCPKTMRRYVTI